MRVETVKRKKLELVTWCLIFPEVYRRPTPSPQLELPLRGLWCLNSGKETLSVLGTRDSTNERL